MWAESIDWEKVRLEVAKGVPMNILAREFVLKSGSGLPRNQGRILNIFVDKTYEAGQESEDPCVRL